MNAYVRDALVTGYEPIKDTLELPDPDGRHVLAAAIRCGADAIITFNAKDFPASVLAPLDIEIIHPGDFICYQLDMALSVCCMAFRAQRNALKKPPMDVDAFLATLQRQQLPQTVSCLRQFAELL